MMKSFEHYDNQLTYPSLGELRRHWRKELQAEIDDTPLTAAQRERKTLELDRKLNEITEQWKATNSEYIAFKKEEARIAEEFRHDLFDDLLKIYPFSADQLALIYQAAYDSGHSYGYPEIHGDAIELASTYKSIRELEKSGNDN